VGEQRRTGLVAAFAAVLADARPAASQAVSFFSAPGLLAHAGLCAAAARSWHRSCSGAYGRSPPHGLLGKFARPGHVYQDMRPCRCEGKPAAAEIAAARSAGAAGAHRRRAGSARAFPPPPRALAEIRAESLPAGRDSGVAACHSGPRRPVLSPPAGDRCGVVSSGASAGWAAAPELPQSTPLRLCWPG
jgi:hypothetical protein